jgi:hypothetical protein
LWFTNQTAAVSKSEESKASHIKHHSILVIYFWLLGNCSWGIYSFMPNG